MVCRCLVFLCIVTGCHRYLRILQLCWKGPESRRGTDGCATPVVQGDHPECTGTFGKEDSQKTSKSDCLVIQAPFLSSYRSPFSDKAGVANDMALWTLSDQQQGETRVLQTLQSTLVQDMETIYAQIEKQECSRKSDVQTGAKQGFGRRRHRLECFSIKCPVDTFNGFRQKCSQEDRDAGWSWTQGAANRAASGEATSAGFFGGNLVSRRRENPRTPQRLTEHGNGTPCSFGTTEGRSDGEATVGSAAKSITHGYINKLNKLKSQVSTACRKIQQLDKEWETFVEATLQKIRQHAQLFQQCRSDLLEAYNLKLGELNALKQEMSSASISMLGETMMPTGTPKAQMWRSRWGTSVLSSI